MILTTRVSVVSLDSPSEKLGTVLHNQSTLAVITPASLKNCTLHQIQTSAILLQQRRKTGTSVINVVMN